MVDKTNSFVNCGLVDFHGLLGLVSRKIYGWIKVAVKRVLRHILRDIDENGAGPSCGGDMMRFPCNSRKIIGVLHEVVVLHDGHGNAENISFLKSVFAEHPENLLARKDDHWNGVHLGCHQPRDGVSCSRTGGHQDSRRLSGCPSIAVGHMDCALFVPYEHKLHVGFDRLERVKHWESSAP